MNIQQIVKIGNTLEVRKTAEGVGELVWSNGRQVCCLGCVRQKDCSEEEHVVAILQACRILGIQSLGAGHLWITIIPSITVIVLDESGKQTLKVLTEVEESPRLQKFREGYTEKQRAGWRYTEEDIAGMIDEYLEKRKSLYQTCGVPWPIGGG